MQFDPLAQRLTWQKNASPLAWVPLFVLVLGVCAVMMLLPAIYAYRLQYHRVGQPFLYGAILFFVVSVLLGLASFGQTSARPARDQLLTLVAIFAVLPAVLAVPFREAYPAMSFSNAYFEMVSSLTTTGATVFSKPDLLPAPLHLWRALVGWFGGFITLLSTVAVLAPMNLGGVEVMRPRHRGALIVSDTQQLPASQRILRYARNLLPFYIALTGALWLALLVGQASPFQAACVAMSTVSTSGILPVASLEQINLGWVGEVLIFCVLITALSRQTYRSGADRHYLSRLKADRELRVAAVFLLSVPLLLFLRHFVGAIEVNDEGNLSAAIRALAGAVFTVMSFLTTTGFMSEHWDAAREWSGLPTPGLALAGLAIVGGGVATTAGGVKLLRVYALYKHGRRELDRLVYPNSVGSAGALGRQVRKQGAFIAWVFFMLLAISIASIVLLLTAVNIKFDAAIILAISALSTTGPLAGVALEEPIAYAGLGDGAKAILIFAMILGRLETLALIALFNPAFWRR